MPMRARLCGSSRRNTPISAMPWYWRIYICMQDDGTYYVLEDVDTLSHGQTQNYRFTRYDADGNILNSNVYDRGPVQISSDGTTISAWDTFIAQPNN